MTGLGHSGLCRAAAVGGGGFLDYLCHRASGMRKATGPRESLIHWLMLAEVGVPLLLAVFFRINALVLVVMIVCLIAHEITGYLDLKLAMATRKVTIFEHQVHSALEMLPLAAMLLVMALHWPQTQALFGFGQEHADFSLGPKQTPRWGEIIPPAAAFLAWRSCLIWKNCGVASAPGHVTNKKPTEFRKVPRTSAIMHETFANLPAVKPRRAGAAFSCDLRRSRGIPV